MAYKNRKQLRKKCPLGTDGALMAAATLTAAGMTTAATLKQSAEQAKAIKENADNQAKATTESAQINANSLTQVSENNKQAVQDQIQAQKDLQESQNDIFKDMNMNFALMAGQQNADERKQEAMIKVAYGSDLTDYKKFANKKADFKKYLNKNITLQDNSYLLPIGDGVALLRGGSPNNPEDQTHDNFHKNTISGKRNKGSFLKFNGKRIEAEAGGQFTTGEAVDPGLGFIFSQRPMFGDGTSPVDRLLRGENKYKVALAQETAKNQMGVNDDGTAKAKYGMKTRLSTHQERLFNKWWNKVAPEGSNSDDYPIDYRRNFKAGNRDFDRYSMKNGGRVKAEYGWNDFLKWKSSSYFNSEPGSILSTNNISNIPTTTSSISNMYKMPSNAPSIQIRGTSNGSIGSGTTSNNSSRSSLSGLGLTTGINLGGQALTTIGNIIGTSKVNEAKSYENQVMQDAYNKRADILVDAYNKLTGIDINDVIKDDDFKAAKAIASIRTGRYNINPQLSELERTNASEIKGLNKGLVNSVARQQLAAQSNIRRFDNAAKLYGEQANRVEQINQSNINELNKMANENADREMAANKNKSDIRWEVAKYNNEVKNKQIMGIGNTEAERVMNLAESNANTNLNIANNTSNAWINNLSGFGNTLSTIGKYVYDSNQTKINNANTRINSMIYSSNPDVAARYLLNNNGNFTKEEFDTAINFVTNDALRNQLIVTRDKLFS